ncbi:hypothetical protein PENSPDRAFT_680028 [Peniophora sp. CONT]|nr:hypothetical protein PENSPDRAFT_680028 [Peniophora sp. CONT]
MTSVRRPLSISTSTADSSPAPRQLHLANTPSPSSSVASFNPPQRKHASRRQSSISYLPPDSPRSWSLRSPPASASQERFSKRATIAVASPSRSTSKENRRRSMIVGPSSTSPLSAAPVEKEAPKEPAENTLTLAEKHAPLLTFIAQKEAKCLELRSQLAAHEQELAVLKQAWERIVRRDFGKTTPSPTPAAPPGPVNVPADGILDSMPAPLARILALNPPSPASPVTVPAQVRTQSIAPRGAAAKRMATHAPSASASTVASTSTTTTTSTRLSQSSTSSVEPMEPEAEADTKTAILSPPPSAPSTPLLPFASERTLRRRSREVKKAEVPDEDARSSPRQNESDFSSIGRRSNASLPPPAGVPGLSSLAAMGLNADVASAAQNWVGKRINESTKTLGKSQKRASMLISDVSQSLFAAFNPGLPSPAGSPAAWPARVSPIAEQPATSLLDADDDDPPAGLGLVMAPSPLMTPTLTPASKPANASTSIATPQHTQEEDDDDWNW